MQITRGVKRKIPWGDYSSTSWEVTVSPEDLGFRQPTNQAEAIALYAVLAAVANGLVYGSLVQEQVIQPAEYQSVTMLFNAAIEQHKEILQKLRGLPNDPG